MTKSPSGGQAIVSLSEATPRKDMKSTGSWNPCSGLMSIQALLLAMYSLKPLGG
jgi:hypothetical protein